MSPLSHLLLTLSNVFVLLFLQDWNWWNYRAVKKWFELTELAHQAEHLPHSQQFLVLLGACFLQDKDWWNYKELKVKWLKPTMPSQYIEHLPLICSLQSMVSSSSYFSRTRTGVIITW